jgi:hypothetical protein
MRKARVKELLDLNFSGLEMEKKVQLIQAYSVRAHAYG